MRCPFCGSADTRVVDSRVARDGRAIRRRRMCADAERCGQRFTTYEVIEDTIPEVRKNDGSTEAFAAEKLLRSLTLACNKRPVNLEQLSRFVRDLEDRLSASPGRSVSSEELGDAALGFLRRHDPVAYVRYASVYRSFHSVDEFMDELKTLKGDGSNESEEPGEPR